MAELATFDGIHFKPIIRGGFWRPRWTREHHVSAKHIPYSDFDDVQSGGSGDWTITVEAYLPAAGDHEQLIARQDAVLRPLALFGDNFAGATLWKVEDGRTYHLDEQQTTVKLTFRRPVESASSGTAPTEPLFAAFTADVSVEGEVTFDFNTSTSPDGWIDRINLEFGVDTDGDGVNDVAPFDGPWQVGGVPPITRPYPAGTYIVNASIERLGNTSADASQELTVS